MSYCEIIRGEVSIRKMYAGGLSYFSSGSGWSGLCGAVWPDAIGSTDRKTRQMKKLVFDTIKNLKLKKVDRISEHTRGVHQIFNANRASGEETGMPEVQARCLRSIFRNSTSSRMRTPSCFAFSSLLPGYAPAST